MPCEREPVLTRALSRAASRACVAVVSDVEKARTAATAQEPSAAELPLQGAWAHGSARVRAASSVGLATGTSENGNSFSALTTLKTSAAGLHGARGDDGVGLEASPPAADMQSEHTEAIWQV